MKPMQSKWLLLALALSACGKNEPAPDAKATAEAPKSIPATPAIPAEPAKKEAEPASVPMTPLVTGAAAQEAKPTEVAAKSPRELRVETIVDEHNVAMEAYYNLFRAAKTDEERQKVAETAKAPDPAPFAERMNALLAEDPADQAAFDALLWFLSERTSPDELTKHLELLEKHHFASERMSKAIMPLQYADDPAAKALLDRLAKDSTHRSVRGLATMAQANALRDKLDQIAHVASASEEERAEMAQYYGAEEVARMAKLDPAETQASAVAMYETILRDYADVPAERRGLLGDIAKATLNEMLNLVVGKTAPDIVGEDIAAVPFKLSDYRGKVVMLDFWGHW